MKVKSESEVAQSCPTLSDPMDCTYQAPPSMGFSRQEYWSGVPLPSPDLLELTPKKDVLFIIGDWNANVGSQEIPGDKASLALERKIKQDKG